MFTKSMFQQKNITKGLIQSSFGLFAINQYYKNRFDTSNECGGILAHVVKIDNSKKSDGVSF